MKHGIVLITLGLLACPLRAQNSITFVDGRDRTPVAGATAVDRAGVIAGMTDTGGTLAGIHPEQYPLSVRSLGYEAATVTKQADTVELAPAVIELTEVAVSTAERPVRRVVCFAREYCTGATSTDTMQMYSEYMLEMFYADDKVKGYNKSDRTARIRAARRYSRHLGAGRDSIARPRHDDDETMLSFVGVLVSVPDATIAETEALAAGAATDTVQGKYGPSTFFRRTPEMFVVSSDKLADHKGHRFSPAIFKLFGMSMEIREFATADAFVPNDARSYGIADYVYGTASMNILGTGRWIKKAFRSRVPVDMRCYVEIYPVDITNISVDEYKELRKDREPLRFSVPGYLLPQLPSAQSLVERVERELPR